jgi:hypothetical protein
MSIVPSGASKAQCPVRSVIPINPALALTRSQGQQSLVRMIEAALEALPPTNP